MRAAMGGELPNVGELASDIMRRLASAADGGAIATAGPRYFGFVIGGSLPVALAADWFASAWDQNAAFYSLSPVAAVAEEIAARWLLDVLDLPRDATVGFTTGCQMANFVGLAAGRRSVLLRRGWDVDEKGLQGAPRVRVVVGGERHVTIPVALQMLGLGGQNVEVVAADEQGRMIPEALAETLDRGDRDAPTIVCAQAGNVNTGAFDPVAEVGQIVHGYEASWLHVDGAFGLWARVAPARRHLAAGLELADSWASDLHKWANVPYDSGLVIVRDAAAHRASMVLRASYLITAETDERDGSDYVPESSRRARGVPIYAALRSLGRDGLADLIERCCTLAARMADALGREPGVEVLNDVVLNQVLVRFGDHHQLTRDVVRRVQEDGTCWLGGSMWHDKAVMRISVSNWSTTEADADMSVEAILRCYRAAHGVGDI
ncbi:MAG: pyridoxal phosphate-dependent decarboxylase family protein [Candidatus Limnocylindrales bacterium]